MNGYKLMLARCYNSLTKW